VCLVEGAVCLVKLCVGGNCVPVELCVWRICESGEKCVLSNCGFGGAMYLVICMSGGVTSGGSVRIVMPFLLVELCDRWSCVSGGAVCLVELCVCWS
jgi:hypothetical protein